MVRGADLGLCGRRPAWVERWWTPARLLFALSLFVFFQSMLISGLIPVVLSSLERRFGFSSKQSGFLLSLCVYAVVARPLALRRALSLSFSRFVAHAKLANLADLV